MSAKKKNTKKNTSKSVKKTNKKVKKVSPAYVDKLQVEATTSATEIETINTEPSVDAIITAPVVPETATFETTIIDNNDNILSGSAEPAYSDIASEQTTPAQDDIVYKDKTHSDIYTSYPSSNNKDVVLIVAAVIFFGVMFVLLAL